MHCGVWRVVCSHAYVVHVFVHIGAQSRHQEFSSMALHFKPWDRASNWTQSPPCWLVWRVTLLQNILSLSLGSFVSGLGSQKGHYAHLDSAVLRDPLWFSHMSSKYFMWWAICLAPRSSLLTRAPSRRRVQSLRFFHLCPQNFLVSPIFWYRKWLKKATGSLVSLWQGLLSNPSSPVKSGYVLFPRVTLTPSLPLSSEALSPTPCIYNPRVW